MADNKQSDASSGTASTEDKKVEHRLLSRKAQRATYRTAAEQALFYLHLVRPCAHPKAQSAVDEELEFTEKQLTVLFGGDSFNQFTAKLRRSTPGRVDAETFAAAKKLKEAQKNVPPPRPREDVLSNLQSSEVDLLIQNLRHTLKIEMWRACKGGFFSKVRYASRTAAPRLGGLLRARLSSTLLCLAVVLTICTVEQVRSLFHLRPTLILVGIVGLTLAIFFSRYTATKGGRSDDVLLRHLGASAMSSRYSRRPYRNQAYFSPVSNKLVTQMWLGLGARAVVLLLPIAIIMFALTARGFWSLSGAGVDVGLELAGLQVGETSALLTGGLFYGLIVLGYLIDVWDFFDPRLVRLQALFVLAVIGFSIFVSRPGIVVAVFSIMGSTYMALAIAARTKRAKFYPLLVTGGLYIAGALLLGYTMWSTSKESWKDPDQAGSAVAQARLTKEDWPRKEREGPIVVMASSGGGTRAAIYTALTLQKLHADVATRNIVCRLEVISSVSGGSLANALYLADRLDNRDCMGIEGPEDLERLGNAERDFVEPTIIGAVNPWRSRGAHLEEAFDNAGLEQKTLSDLIGRVGDKRVEPIPVPLFNSTNLESHAVVISPLAAPQYQNEALQGIAKHHYARTSHTCCDSEPTWVYQRDAIYGLDDLLPNFDVPLASAVRASANFPFGFTLVKIKTDKPRRFSPKAEWNAKSSEPPEMSLTDGGVLSNSGLHTLYQLLVNRVKDFGKHGVVLMIVEASYMQEIPDEMDRTLLRSIGDQSAIAQAHHRRMLAHLHELYGGKFRVVQIALTAHEDHNVVTSWTLSPKTIVKLKDDHKAHWDKFKTALVEADAAVGSSTDTPRRKAPKPLLLRPPSD